MSDDESDDSLDWTETLGPGHADVELEVAGHTVKLYQSLNENRLAPLFDETWIGSQVNTSTATVPLSSTPSKRPSSQMNAGLGRSPGAGGISR